MDCDRRTEDEESAIDQGECMVIQSSSQPLEFRKTFRARAGVEKRKQAISYVLIPYTGTVADSSLP